MKKSDVLKQELDGLVRQQAGIVETAEKEQNRSLTAEENTTFDDLQRQIEAKKVDLQRAIALEENQRMFGGNGSNSVKPEEREFEKMLRGYSIHEVMRDLNGGTEVSGATREVSDEFARRAKEAGLAIAGRAIPVGPVRADGQTSTQDSGGYGGNLVQTDVQAPIEFLRPKLAIEQLGAKYYTGVTGNLKFPKNDGGITATWEGEVDTVGTSKNAIGAVDLPPIRLATKMLISIQNLMQTGGLIERMTLEDANRLLAITIEAAAIAGPGSTQPTGILNWSGVNSVAIGTNGGDPTLAKIIEMETAINTANADSNSLAYLFNAKTRGKLKSTPKVSGQPVFLMSENGDTNGYRSMMSNLLPSNLTKGTGSNLSAAIFGDFSQLNVFTWAFADLVVDRQSEAESGYVKYVINTFNNVLVRQPKAFVHCKDIVTA